jgi:hypothetical protein
MSFVRLQREKTRYLEGILEGDDSKMSISPTVNELLLLAGAETVAVGMLSPKISLKIKYKISKLL